MYTPTASVLVGLAALKGASAWGTLGHATVAAKSVLSDTSTSYLANVASWADTYRSTAAGKFSAPYHFIDANDSPPSSCNVNYARDCTSSGCSISAISNYTQRVADARLSTASTAEALKFLVHLLGDVTQPLHDEALEVGGNDIKVTFDGYANDNLHSDWDTYIPEKKVGGDSLTDAQSWAKTLIASIDSGSYKSLASSWVAKSNINDAVTSATAWASDANALVCTVVMPNGVAALQTGDLYPTYYNKVIPTVELQIAKGGYRLADWLNKIYSANIAKRDLEGQSEELVSRMAMAAPLPPANRPNKAQLAREAYGGGCGCDKHKK
ncbi:uncharacterized protein N0V89_010674 [Didymosphaeria variabile]|uniref:Nuclease PA3 n=1 Tax=Didymosphaeria variabile TaxID=1932322 RepID=A0A9W8XDC9_9PLEO|nr:uncharacterized protein N0V89_010674 [Didymosphaeria variabile]KAJ4346742.1 hypothetical protein N0V89_010674 [Didymosphaeria variabile]